jgi:hypothetical protein
MANGKARVAVTNPVLTPAVETDSANVTDVPGSANHALLLETIAAETYRAETSQLISRVAIGLSASIEPVAMHHNVILSYVLGHYLGAQNAADVPFTRSSTAKTV